MTCNIKCFINETAKRRIENCLWFKKKNSNSMLVKKFGFKYESDYFTIIRKFSVIVISVTAFSKNKMHLVDSLKAGRSQDLVLE